MWQAGDRILAQRGPGVYWYPGTIRHIDEQRYYVIFDDGEDAFANKDELVRLAFSKGDQVFVLNESIEEYVGARVVGVASGGLRVRYKTGDEQPVEWQKIRVDIDTWKEPEATEEVLPSVPMHWNLCDRVLACYYDLEWYPGVVLHVERDRITILFDHGGQAMVTPNKVRPLKLEVGDKVTCRSKFAPEFYPGEIAHIEGERVHIVFEDGEEEKTSIRLVRLRRDSWFETRSEVPLLIGSRVLAQFYDLFWYPGVILGVEGKRVQIAYENGEQGFVTPDQLRGLKIEVGSRVFYQARGGQEYQPGEVIGKEGEKVQVRFDDGHSEWGWVRMLRLER